MSEGNRKMLLKTRGLTKQFGKHVAVDHVDMHIRRGAIYGFIGRNVLRYEQKTGSLFRYL